MRHIDLDFVAYIDYVKIETDVARSLNIARHIKRIPSFVPDIIIRPVDKIIQIMSSLTTYDIVSAFVDLGSKQPINRYLVNIINIEYHDESGQYVTEVMPESIRPFMNTYVVAVP